MQARFRGKRVSAILGVLPECESYFDDEVGNYDFPEKQTLRLKKVMGFQKHRLSKGTSTVSDFAVFGMDYILREGWISKDEIGAIVVVTLSPDFFVPHIGSIIQSECGLGTDILCLDIAQGCCGFLIGLMEAFLLLDHLDGKKVVLVNGDVLSHKVSRRDRNDFPLIGDAVTLSVIENDGGSGDVFYEMHMDGSRGDALKIPAGGFRMPSTSETAELVDQGDGNYRALDHIHMDGNGVFNFVQKEVPPLLAHMLETTGETMETIDYFLFHQPNKFMLQKLAEKAGIPKEKLPMDLVENYGNPSGASIPLVIAADLGEEFQSGMYKCCLSAFGSGLAWGGMILELGNMDHCGLVVSGL